MKGLLLLALFAVLSPQAFAAKVLAISVNGTINPGSAAYILNAIHVAESEKDDALLLRLDTPGGLLTSTRHIIEGFSESRVPVIVWIGPGGASATSAGALITMAAHISAMAPGTNLGAAHPVGPQGEDVKGTMGEKVTNDTAALARAQAVLRGRNPETAEAIVTHSRSFSAEEAVTAGAVDFIAGDPETLLEKAGTKKIRMENPLRELNLSLKNAAMIPLAMSPRQQFLHFLADPNVSTVLLTLGGIALWAEVSSGFSSLAAGIVGIFCFLLGFISLETLPVNIGGAALLCVGLILLIADALVTSHGLLTVASLGAILLGGFFLIDPSLGSMHVSFFLLGSILVSLGTVVAIVGVQLARDRHRLHSTKDPVVGAEAKVATVEAGGLSGTAYVNGELWTFDSTIPLQTGESVWVHSVKAMRVQVDKRRI
jgi:membrane-bound serine protease (ClpP class)